MVAYPTDWIGWSRRPAPWKSRVTTAAGPPKPATTRSCPLLLAAEHTSRIELGTNIAVAFARNPMTVANLAWDLQAYSQGRFILGLGTQIQAHIEKRFSMPWSHPARRMQEFVAALYAIWSAWKEDTKLRFEGEFYTHKIMTPMFTPEPHPYPRPKIFLAAVGPTGIWVTRWCPSAT